jgi:PAS domain S-box-containing protein
MTGENGNTAGGGGTGKGLPGQPELLRAITQHSMVGIAVIAEGRIVFANDGITNLVGSTPDELIARDVGSFFDLVHPADRDMAMDRFVKRMEGGKGLPDQYDLRILHRDGSVKWAAVRPEWADLGETRALVVSFVDITERKLAEMARSESEERYRYLFDHAPLGIALTTLDGKIFELNDAMGRFSTLPLEELLIFWFGTSPRSALPSAPSGAARSATASSSTWPPSASPCSIPRAGF